jgi:hypothetical protein
MSENAPTLPNQKDKASIGWAFREAGKIERLFLMPRTKKGGRSRPLTIRNLHSGCRCRTAACVNAAFSSFPRELPTRPLCSCTCPEHETSAREPSENRACSLRGPHRGTRLRTGSALDRRDGRLSAVPSNPGSACLLWLASHPMRTSLMAGDRHI